MTQETRMLVDGLRSQLSGRAAFLSVLPVETDQQ